MRILCRVVGLRSSEMKSSLWGSGRAGSDKRGLQGFNLSEHGKKTQSQWFVIIFPEEF